MTFAYSNAGLAPVPYVLRCPFSHANRTGDSRLLALCASEIFHVSSRRPDMATYDVMCACVCVFNSSRKPHQDGVTSAPSSRRSRHHRMRVHCVYTSVRAEALMGFLDGFWAAVSVCFSVYYRRYTLWTLCSPYNLFPAGCWCLCCLLGLPLYDIRCGYVCIRSVARIRACVSVYHPCSFY